MPQLEPSRRLTYHRPAREADPAPTPPPEDTHETKPLNEPALQKFEEALRDMPLAGGARGFNDYALPQAARLAKLAGLSEEDAVRRILATQAGAPRDPDREVRYTVANIYADDSDPGDRDRRRPPKRDPRLIEHTIAGSQFTLDDLRKQSPVSNPEELPPKAILTQLYRGDQLVTIGKKAEGGHVTATTDLLSSLTPEGLARMELIVPSAAVRKEGTTQSGAPSRHSADMYGKRQYIVVEFDGMSESDQVKVIWHLRQFVPLALMVHSGNKSLHAWFSCEHETVTEGDVGRFFHYAVKLGADAALRTISHFARMPNAVRASNGNRQSVLYFDPNAVGQKWKLSELPGSWQVRSLMEIPEADSAESNLNGNRFLTRGRAAMLIGPSGIGKSSLLMQMGMMWAVGEPFMGITAQEALRVLYVQAENDDEDLRFAP